MIYIRQKFIMEAEHKPRFQKCFKLKCVQMAVLFHSLLQGLSWVLWVLNCWGSCSLHRGILSVMTNAKSLVLPPPQACVLALPTFHTHNCPALLLELSHTPHRHQQRWAWRPPSVRAVGHTNTFLILSCLSVLLPSTCLVL